MISWSLCNDHDHKWGNDPICMYKENCINCGLVRFRDKGYNLYDYKTFEYVSHYRPTSTNEPLKDFVWCEKYKHLYNSFCDYTKKKRLYSSNLEIFDKFLQQLFEKI